MTSRQIAHNGDIRRMEKKNMIDSPLDRTEETDRNMATLQFRKKNPIESP